MKLALVREGIILKELDTERLVCSVGVDIEAKIADEISQLFLLKKKTKRNEVLEILQKYSNIYTKSIVRALKQESVSIH